MGYNIKEVMEILGVSESTVRRMLKDGRLEGELIEGYYGEQYDISHEAVERLKEKQTIVLIEPENNHAMTDQILEKMKTAIAEQVAQQVNEQIDKRMEELERHIEQRDQVLIEGLRNIQERQKQQAMLLEEKSKPWYKKIFNFQNL